mmetsp:Transcript_25512/g.29569  ORF Transcript_25512/g.29569 Transcript_25512/m.29569 type:complete len:307 (-) Transcript_25512:50-970(-)
MDGGEYSFHTSSIIIGIDEHQKFDRFLRHPLTYCGCPNGCIMCSHIGGIILVCHVICRLSQKYNNSITFDDICNSFTTPVNEVLQAPMSVSGTFSASKLRRREEARTNTYNKYNEKRKMLRRSLNSSSFNTTEEDGTFESFTGDDDDLLNFGILARSNDDDDELDEFAELGRYKAIGGIVDASDTPIYKIVTKINEWADSLSFDNESNNNGGYFFSTERSRREVVEMKDLKNLNQYKTTQLIVMDRVHEKMLKYLESKYGNQNIDERPIILPMLKVTQAKRELMKIELVEELKDVDLKKKVVVDNL